jgi:hypothetical protein
LALIVLVTYSIYCSWVIKIQNETEALLLSQIIGVSNTEYIAKTTAAAKGASSEKSENSSKEVEGKLALDTSTSTSTISSSTTDNSAYQTILAKANNGQQLTNAELAILKEKNPAAYAKAIRTNVVRQELVSQMEKSPNQANRVLDEALSSLSTKNDEDRTMFTKALTAEYNNFVSKHDQVIISSSVE